MRRKNQLPPQQQSPSFLIIVSNILATSTPLCLRSLVIPYISDEHAEAATKIPTLKLTFRLLKFTIRDEGSFFRGIYSNDSLISS